MTDDRINLDPARIIFAEDYYGDPEGMRQRMAWESAMYGEVHIVTHRAKPPGEPPIANRSHVHDVS